MSDALPPHGVATPEVSPRPPVGPWPIFVGFSKLALSGFGGVMPMAYRHIVERLQWHSAEEFAQMFAFAQLLPGPTICNLSVMVGWHQARLAGALAALAGMLAGPILVVLLLGSAYARFGDSPTIHAALGGMSAVAAGLIMATAVKMGIALLKTTSGWQARLWLGGLAAVAFVCVGLVHWPLIAVVLGLGPLAVAVNLLRRP